MNLDWLTTLGVADQSLEAQLAKRDLAKKAALVSNLAKMQEDFRQNREQEQFRQEQLKEQSLLRQATLRQAQAYHDQTQQDRQDALDRQEYDTGVENLKSNISHGVVPRVTSQRLHDLISRFEGTGNLSQVPNPTVQPGEGDPNQENLPEWYYMRAAAEDQIHKADMAEKKAAAIEKARAHSQSLQDEANYRANEKAKRDQAQEEREVKLFNERFATAVANRKAAEKRLEVHPGAAVAIGKRAKEIMAAQGGLSGMWNYISGAQQQHLNEAEAYAQAAQEVEHLPNIDTGGPEPKVAVSTGGRGGAPAGAAGKTITTTINGKTVTIVKH